MSRKALKSPLFVVLAAVIVGITIFGAGSASVQHVLGQGKNTVAEPVGGGVGTGPGGGFGNVDFCPVQTDPQGTPYALCGQGNSCPSGSSCVVLGSTGQGGNTVQCSYCVPQNNQLPCEITDTCPPGDNPNNPSHQFNFSLSNNGPLNFNYSTSGTQTGNATIQISLDDTPAQPVNLAVTNPPGTNPSGVGITASISGSQTCTPNCSKTLVVNVPARMPAGTYAVTVEGSHGNLERTTNVMVNVNPVAIPAECGFDTAPEAKPLCGFAWSGTNEGNNTGAGWISFNSSDIAGSATTYKVTMSEDGTLRGCAWSPNVGWIKFGGATPLSDQPSYNSNLDVTAKMSTNSNSVTQTGVSLQGWARACAGTVNSSNPDLPGNCSSMTPRLDWDGWISLKTAVAGGSVTFNNGAFSGFAWGGDVLGWINWSPGPNPSNGVRFCSVQIPDFVVSSLGAEIAPGETGQAIVTADRLNAGTPFPSGITFSVVSLPIGITNASFANAVCGASSPCSKAMTIEVGANTANGVYNIPVIATVTTDQGEMSRTINVPVTVDDTIGPGGNLTLTCTPPAPETIFVNRPVVVTVGIEGDTEGNLYYSTDGTEPTSPSGGVPSLTSVSRTFTTVGRKTFTIRVKDSATPTAAEGLCDVTVDVKVAPSIIEI